MSFTVNILPRKIGVLQNVRQALWLGRILWNDPEAYSMLRALENRVVRRITASKR
jgi:hypothetical protein